MSEFVKTAIANAMPAGANPNDPGTRGAAAAEAIFGTDVILRTIGKIADDPAPAVADPKGKPAPAPEKTDVTMKAEATEAFKARDKAKAQFRRSNAIISALTAKLGISPADLKIIENGDTIDVEADSLTTAAELLVAHRRQPLLTDLANTSKEAKAATARAAALEEWIDANAGDSAIREALASQKAIRDGTGNYDDLIALIKPRLKREASIDEETGKAVVKFTPLNKDLTPMIHASGNIASVPQLVESWLSERPHLKGARVSRGPGAGGYGVGPQAGAPTMTSAERGLAAGRAVFGPAVDRFVNGERLSAGEAVFGAIGRPRQ